MTNPGLAPFACPRCGTVLTPAGDDRLTCPADGSAFSREDAIWRFLSTDERDRWRGFLDLYSRVRREEGWRGPSEPDALRALPEVPATDPRRTIWNIRRISLETLKRRTVAPMRARRGRPLRIADLGAGNGWLGNRLAEDGHRIAAIDIDDDESDGLGACRSYRRDQLIAVQATFERLPWPDESFDLAVFNGALHYAVDIATPLTEALRVLRADGRLVILDSPFYRRRSSGERMIEERDRSFRERHRARSSIDHEGFLTRARIEEVGRALGVDWRILRPWYGLDWALRPLKNRLLGLREPARFFYVEGRRRA